MEAYLSAFITLALAHFIALLSPGVDFFIILSNSSKYGKLSGIITSFGIAIANLVYILLALLGITLVKENQNIFLFIKVLGSLYLIYIAFMLLKTKKRDLFSKEKLRSENKKSLIKYFSMGFLSAILNPKNSIFYFTMFSISINNTTPLSIQSFYALWMFLAVLFWDIFIVYLITNKKSKYIFQKYSNYIEKICGLILLFIASFIIIDSF
ncbi:LysE family translocator [Halarcobacter bivalviorum]|uniref:Lysine transporter LysE n=1 Tax=Halarcobacter bivalviorum TaxID=663364 RepID=A0AAX2A763_9BACT|nr:LysE family translocator [Halarcobacter bivalviorum]AXH11052.1 threonine/homoserine/homoserine lactone efflux protein, LysE family [Halarcobacter bivalviorum]RXK09759.1 lysine transporter LysE [Halarcobacter bivalviorum]